MADTGVDEHDSANSKVRAAARIWIDSAGWAGRLAGRAQRTWRLGLALGHDSVGTSPATWSLGLQARQRGQGNRVETAGVESLVATPGNVDWADAARAGIN